MARTTYQPCNLIHSPYFATKNSSGGQNFPWGKKNKTNNKTTQGSERYSSIVLINSKAPGKTLAGIAEPGVYVGGSLLVLSH